jgi:chromosome segregation ATPase
LNLLNVFTKKKPINFDKKILRKNDISLLIVDERWNALFKKEEKTAKIIQYEEKLRDLLKEQARLTTEEQDILRIKKVCMDKIIKLTDEAYEKNNPAALKEMQHCHDEINRINERLVVIQQALENIPDQIKETNLYLLEATVDKVYTKIKTGQKKINELEEKIETMKAELKQCINEKEELSELVTNAYSYFHDLLGAEELERLDKEFL